MVLAAALKFRASLSPMLCHLRCAKHECTTSLIVHRHHHQCVQVAAINPATRKQRELYIGGLPIPCADIALQASRPLCSALPALLAVSPVVGGLPIPCADIALQVSRALCFFLYLLALPLRRCRLVGELPRASFCFFALFALLGLLALVAWHGVGHLPLIARLFLQIECCARCWLARGGWRYGQHASPFHMYTAQSSPCHSSLPPFLPASLRSPS